MVYLSHWCVNVGFWLLFYRKRIITTTILSTETPFSLNIRHWISFHRLFCTVNTPTLTISHDPQSCSSGRTLYLTLSTPFTGRFRNKPALRSLVYRLYSPLSITGTVSLSRNMPFVAASDFLCYFKIFTRIFRFLGPTTTATVNPPKNKSSRSTRDMAADGSYELLEDPNY